MFMLPTILSDYRAVGLVVGSHHRASDRIPSLTVELGSSFFRFGGIVVIRHFTVPSDALISNPMSFVKTGK